MVRISRRRHLELLQGALRAHQLEDQLRALRARRAAQDAQTLRRRLNVPEAASSPDLLPLTPGGDLHQAAYVAWAEAEVWAERERRLSVLTAADRNGDHS